MEHHDLEFPLSNGSHPQAIRRSDQQHGHDRNLSLPSNSSPSKEQHTFSRPNRAATFSRPSAAVPSRRPQIVATESTPVIPQRDRLITPQTSVPEEKNMIYQGSAISSPTEGIHPHHAAHDLRNGEVHASIDIPDPEISASSNQANMAARKQTKSDPKTPSEYALHILFTQFVRYAERKVNQCLSYASESEPRISDILGEGVDPAFDKIIASLAYISRRKPKPVIDSVMFWRKSKSEAASAAAQGSSTVQPSSVTHSRSGSRQESLEPRFAAIQADRKSLISIFILCRVLMEVVKQTPADVLGEDLSEKLEEIVFKQLRTAEPDLIASSVIRRSNWTLFAELLGEMSENRFISVTDRFIAVLEKITPLPAKDTEANTYLVIHGMQYLKLRLYPMDMLEESANFLESLAKFFARTQSMRIKLAYAEVISQILLPIAGVATAELNHPTWATSVQSLFQRANEMIVKTKHWQSAFGLATTALSVAPQELFLNNWMNLFESNATRLKERTNRAVFYTGAARLVWVYVCRCTESLNATTKKLERVMKVLFHPSGRKAWLIADPRVNPACISFIRIAAVGYRQFILDNVLTQLLLGSNASDVSSLDGLIPERAIISIRAAVLILVDSQSERPAFPTDTVLQDMYNNPHIEEPTKSLSPTGPLKEFYDKYLGILVKIFMICDSQFGASGSVTDEKPAQQRAPMAVPFHFGSSETAAQNLKATFTGLFCTIIEAFPWLLTKQHQSKVVDILCRNAIHQSGRISQAACKALKSLAHTRDSKSVLSTVSKLLFSFDEKMFSTYEPVASAKSDYERLLKLYTELLEIWIERIRNQSEEDDKRGDDALVNGWWPTIEEVEGNGLYFLFSPERSVRSLGITILRLTASFDSAVREHEEQMERSHSRAPSKSSMVAPMRLITYLESVDIQSLFEQAQPEVRLSMPEKTKLLKLSGSKKKGGLIRVCESDHGVDSALWLKAFPNVLKDCCEKYPMPVAIARSTVCFRLVAMHDMVTEFMVNADIRQQPKHEVYQKHSTQTHPEAIIEQWRSYLVVACIALTLADEQRLHVPDSSSAHRRKKSVQKITIHHQKITSIKSVFRMVIPLLGVEHPIIRDAIVRGLGCINVNTYPVLLECMKPAIEAWKNESKPKYVPGGRRDLTIGYRQDRTITEIAHVFQATNYYLRNPVIYNNDQCVSQLLDFLKDLRTFLARSDIQTSWDYQRLRRYFCGIVDTLVQGVGKSEQTAKLLTFDVRLKFYSLIEEWSQFGVHQSLARDRDAIMKQAALTAAKESRDKNMVVATMELENRKSETAILSAMASLCSGPLTNQLVDSNGDVKSSRFNLGGILKWINAAVRNRDDIQAIGCTALKNLLIANPKDSQLFTESVANCYQIATREDRIEEAANISRCYFQTVAQVVLENPEYPYEVRQILTLGLFKTGDENFEIRSLAVQLLRAAELRFYGMTCMQEFEARALSRSPPIYKRVLFDLSGRFAQDHPQESAMILSEMFMFFHRVSDTNRRDILSVILPWVQSVELTVEQPNDQLSPSSMMVLCNLLEITVSFSDRISNEVEALWVAVISKISTNLKVVTDFLFRQSMAKRDAQFVQYARKIVLYLSTIQRHSICEMLTAQLTPKSMIPMHPEPYDAAEAKQIYPHVAEISELLPPRTKENAFSQGQLAMIMLVDLLISPDESIIPQIPLLLQASISLMDHYLPIVQEQAREMLVLIVIAYAPRTDERVELCDSLRRKDEKTKWDYDDLNSDKNGAQTPRALDLLINLVLEQIEYAYPDVRKRWARIALSWATSCPVRHIACRSFQIFRCLLSFVDQGMLADMLARLSNTISDGTPDIQGFAMQILMTLNAITAELASEELINFPQLFWTAVACMGTIHEQEFIEALSILEKFLSKIDLDSPDTVSCLASTFPPKWEGKFEGLQQIVMIGLRSANSWDQSLRVLDKLNNLNDSEIVAGDERLVMAVCANMPRFMEALERSNITPEIAASAERLRDLCDHQGRTGLSRILTSLAKGRFRSTKDFLQQTMLAIQSNFFPQHEVPVLSFLLGILSNKTRWVKVQAMDMLKLVFPMVDMQREELAGVGADLISPLLRLLQTDYAEQALSVLDEASSISSSKMDKHVLRMSLGNRTLRKEYEKTHTLFGIPDESGWAVPMPAVTASITRNNVHSVFYTCASSKFSAEEGEEDEFQFHKEEQYGYSLDRVDTVSVEGSMNQMWTALDNLDTFFAGTTSQKRSARGGGHSYKHSLQSVTDTDASMDNTIEAVESAPQLYDKKVSLILNRSLARTPSTTSFKTSLADSFVSPAGNSSNGPPSSSPSFSDLRLAHLRGGYYEPRSKRREIVDFGENLTEIDDLSDGDGDDEHDDRSYNSFDTVRYGGTGTGGNGSSISSPMSPPVIQIPNHLSPHGTPPGASPPPPPPPPAPPLPSMQSQYRAPVESSFRLESLLKGASNIGKKKKSKDKEKEKEKNNEGGKRKSKDKEKEKNKKKDKKRKEGGFDYLHNQSPFATNHRSSPVSPPRGVIHPTTPLMNQTGFNDIPSSNASSSGANGGNSGSTSVSGKSGFQFPPQKR